MIKEDHRSFKVPCYKGDTGNKALEVFTKLKQKTKEADSTMSNRQVTPVRELEPSHEEMQCRTMNSDRVGRR